MFANEASQRWLVDIVDIANSIYRLCDVNTLRYDTVRYDTLRYDTIMIRIRVGFLSFVRLDEVGWDRVGVMGMRR